MCQQSLATVELQRQRIVCLIFGAPPICKFDLDSARSIEWITGGAQTLVYLSIGKYFSAVQLFLQPDLDEGLVGHVTCIGSDLDRVQQMLRQTQ